MMPDGLPSMCGCHQCGGSEARARAILALRVIAWSRYITARRHANGRTLANRTVRPDLYSRLVMARARGYGIASEDSR
jgi:hypothetical protein